MQLTQSSTATYVLRIIISSTFSYRRISTNSFQLFAPNATVKLVIQRYMWLSVKSDCRKWARACKRAKISKHASSPVGTFVSPSSRIEHIHIDLVEPLPMSQGFRYCLTCVNRFSRWPEVISMDNMDAPTIAKVLITGWIS